ncbi:MAG: transposase [Acidobacteria bacterium]|nr:MAG: transposase [Acidobacteriota bacterium]
MSTRRDSTTDKRQKNQYRLAFAEESRGAAPMASVGGTESELAKRRAENPTTEQWMEEVCERENCKQALRRVKANIIVLNELDQELERRGHRFTRYADDCNIYVRSRRAGERVMRSVTRLLTTKLKLRVNSEKSAVARPWERKFLGFSFTNHKPPKRRLAPKAMARFKERVRELTSRTRGISLARMVQDLAEYLRGWIGYFGRCETPEVLAKLEKWLRRRLRSMVWKQWKRGTTRYRELRKRGIAAQDAAKTAGSSDGPWHLANTPALKIALSNAYFASFGLPELTAHG